MCIWLKWGQSCIHVRNISTTFQDTVRFNSHVEAWLLEKQGKKAFTLCFIDNRKDTFALKNNTSHVVIGMGGKFRPSLNCIVESAFPLSRNMVKLYNSSIYVLLHASAINFSIYIIIVQVFWRNRWRVARKSKTKNCLALCNRHLITITHNNFRN